MGFSRLIRLIKWRSSLSITERAIAEYKRALEIDPKLQEAKDDLARIEDE